MASTGTTPGTTVTITAIGDRARRHGEIYARLALETGGVVVRALPWDNLAAPFKRLLDDFQSSYVLHFSPRGVDPGGLHTLDVHVRQRGVDVRARKSYLWR